MPEEDNTPGSVIAELRSPTVFTRLVAALAILGGLCLVSLWNYLLFHGIVEIAGIAVAFAIFIIIWNLRRLIPDTFFLIVGISFLFIGCIDVVHTLAYQGMGVFPGGGADLPTQLWIAARYFQSIAFLIATCFIGRSITKDRKYDAWIILSACAAACILLFSSIFVWHCFPACFIEGYGLTPFKINSEIVISLLLLTAIVVLYLNRRHINPPIFRSLVAAQVFLILGELAFTSYASVYGFMNLLGHLFRLISVWFFYRAFVDLTMAQIYDNITRELRQKDILLRESEQMYRGLYRYAQAGLFETRLNEATIVSCNQRFSALVGFPNCEEAIGQDVSRLYEDPDARSGVSRILREKGSIENQIMRFRNRATGSLFWGEFSARYDPVRDVVEGSIIDVTAQKEAEERLIESESRLRSFIETTLDSIVIVDEEGTVIEWNAGSEKLCGIPREEALGRYLWDINFRLLPPEQRTEARRAELEQTIRTSLATGVSAFKEPQVIEAVRSDGTRFFSRQAIFPIRTARGFRFGSVAQDITPEKRAELALQESNKRLQEAQELAHLGFWTWDVRTGQVEWSDEVFRIFGLDPNEFTPQIDSILARSPWPGEQQRGQELIRRATESREPGTYEQRFLRPDQSLGYYFSTFQGRYDDAGTLTSIAGTVLDITGRKKAEDALRQSETRFRTLVEQLPIGIAMTRTEGGGETVFYLNQTFTSITGYTLETTPTFDAWALRAYPDPHDRQRMAGIATEMYAEAGRGITSRPRITSVTCLDGTVKEIAFRYTNLGVFGFWTLDDITEHKRGEALIRKTNEQLSQAQSIAHIGSWEYDLLNNVIEWSDETYRIFGYEPGSFEPDLEITRTRIHPDDLARQDQILVRASATNLYPPTEYRIIRPDGTVRYIYGDAAVTSDDAGNAIKIIGIIQDITERKLAEFALAESERKYREFFTTSRDCVFITSPQGRWIDFNNAALELFGYGSREELLAVPIQALYEDKEERRRFNALIIRDGEVKEYPVRLVKADDTVIDTLITAVPLRNQDGTAKAFTGSIRDITEQKRAEHQREALIKELERKNAELERFTYTVSHDLKSPLITIKGFAGMLEYDAKSSDSCLLDRDITRIKMAADTMEKLLGDLLELSRVGRIITPPKKTSFGEIAKEAVDLLAGPLAERGMAVTIAPDLPDVDVDRVRIREVMVNLLENAIKFMGDRPDPRIRIGVETGGPMPVFFVKDNGTGVDPRYLDRIFNLFEKLDGKTIGTGVGLAIVKRIIEAHGGKCWAESEGAGKGTTFRFTLPAAGTHTTDNNNNR
jgi:PAS domain S-box-containing protein